MNDHVCPRDRQLTLASMLIGIAVWAGAGWLVARAGGTSALMGAASVIVVVAVVSLLGYVFVRSALIAHLRGGAVQVTEQQWPELYRQLSACSEALGRRTRQAMYVQNGNGVLNAFATWFLGHQYIILNSNIVDAMEGSPNGVRFYIGHELGHVFRHDRVLIAVLRWPALGLPLLGAAFSRARESTCDLHGLACSVSREDGARSLVALAAGSRRWSDLSLDAYRSQLASATGFWMSFHELIASYPWTVKRVVRVLDERPLIPPRNPFAYLLALLVPYAGRVPAGIGVLLYFYFIGVTAAIAVPAYQDYGVRTRLTAVAAETEGARVRLADYYEANHRIPVSLEEAGVPARLADGTDLSLDSQRMVLAVHSRSGALVFTPYKDQRGKIGWHCSGNGTSRPGALPIACR
jgi:Zn-dependent protease with chaperone function